MVKHQETHPTLDVEGCYGCKISHIKVGTASFSRDRKGEGPGGSMTNREYVRKMYEDRRAAGLPDPEPANRASAAFAPKRGVMR